MMELVLWCLRAALATFIVYGLFECYERKKEREWKKNFDRHIQQSTRRGE